MANAARPDEPLRYRREVRCRHPVEISTICNELGVVPHRVIKVLLRWPVDIDGPIKFAVMKRDSELIVIAPPLRVSGGDNVMTCQEALLRLRLVLAFIVHHRAHAP